MSALIQLYHLDMKMLKIIAKYMHYPMQKCSSLVSVFACHKKTQKCHKKAEYIVYGNYCVNCAQFMCIFSISHD